MDETNIVNALQTVMADPSIADAFNKGLYFGATVAAGCIAFFMLRKTPGDPPEEL